MNAVWGAPLGDAFSAAAVGVCLLAMAQLALRTNAAPATRRLHLQALLVFFAVLILDQLNNFYEGSTVMTGHPGYIGLTDMLLPLLPAALWLYIRALTDPEPVWRRTDWRHGLPFAVAVVLGIPFRQMTGAQKLAFWELGPVTLDVLPLLAAIGEVGFWFVWFGAIVGYGIACVRRLRLHRQRVRDLFSTDDGAGLRWVTVLLGGVAMLAVIVATDEFASEMFNAPLLVDVSAGLFALALALFLGVFGMLQDPLMPHWTAAVLRESEPIAPDAESTAVGAAYANSALGTEDCDRILQRLDDAMRARELWRDPTLSLKDLSEATGVRPSYITQSLNTRGGRNFYDYVNSMRIDAAKRLLLDTDDSVTDVSLEAGFNSRSTFYTAFKRATGSTPTEFRRNAALVSTTQDAEPSRR